MRNLFAVFLFLAAFPAVAQNGPDEAQVRQAVQDAKAAIVAADVEAWAQYFNEDSAITMDMDPVVGRGKRELDYATFLRVASVGIEGLENPEVVQTIESLERDEDTGDMLLVLQTSIRSDLLGMRMEEVTRSETRYGLLDGELRVVSYTEEVLSSGPIQP